jgi:hypothetical protein
MFSLPRKGRKPNGGVSRSSHPSINEVKERSHQWQAWRQAARKVTRVWNEWLPAGAHDESMRYRAYILALAEEEQAAAAIEQSADLAPTGTSTGRHVAPSQL